MQVLALIGAYMFLLFCVIVTGYMISLFYKWIKRGKTAGNSKIKLENTAGMTHKEKKAYNKKISEEIRKEQAKKREFLLNGFKKKKNKEGDEINGESGGEDS